MGGTGIWGFLQMLIAPGAALAGVWLSNRATLSRLKTERKIEFISRQLHELYSPLLALKTHVRAYGDLRLRISKAADGAWREKVAQEKSLGWDHEKAFEPYKKLILSGNEQLRKEIIPLYHKMLDLLKENFWLAEPETRRWYAALYEYVELWDQYLSDEIPRDALAKLDQGEEKLKPLYTELEERFGLLQRQLAGG